MALVHGTWIFQAQQSYFFLWSEVWRSESAVSPPAYPFGGDRQSLEAQLQAHGVTMPENAQWLETTFSLPSTKGTKTKPSIPLLSNQTQIPNQLVWADWQIAGLALNARQATNIIQTLPLTDEALAGDLRFWWQVCRWSLDLVVRCKFLPHVTPLPTGEALATWVPLLDSVTEQQRFAQFLQQMPGICAVGQRPAQVLLSFLTAMVDAQVRPHAKPLQNFPKTSVVFPWCDRLSKAKATFEDLPRQLGHAYENWTFPVREYLVNPPDFALKQPLFRACFQLLPPTAAQDHWQLQYGLQALGNAASIVTADQVWQDPSQPQEILLKGLGLASRLYEPIGESLGGPQPCGCPLDAIQAYEFIRSVAWQLRDKGLGVILPEGLGAGSNEVRLGIKISAQVKDESRLNLQSLLQYNLAVAVGETTLTEREFQDLLARRSPLVEVNGQWLALQPTDVRAAQEIYQTKIGEQPLRVEDALRLGAESGQVFAKLPVIGFEASGALRELLDHLTNNESLKLIEPPDSLQGTLRPYQHKGMSWLSFLQKWGLGACLADDMGLGKTIQAIAFLLTLQENKKLTQPVLLVCPTSVVSNWEREISKFAPSLKTLIHHGDRRAKGKTFASTAQQYDVILTSYSLVFRDQKDLATVSWQGVILDEAQNIKNPQAKQSQAVRALDSGFRIALTGTPVENRLKELWSILDFLNPNFLGTQQFFQRRFAIPIEKYGDRQTLQSLRKLTQPFILRRLKTDKTIIQDLPEKQEMEVFCSLSKDQANLYQKLVDESLAEIENTDGIQRRGLILTLLLRLKQLCNHPVLLQSKPKLGKNFAPRSGKLLRLEEMLEELISEGDRALIFTQFSEWGKLLQPYLQERLGQDVLFLYGATRRETRQQMCDRFQNDPNGPPIFILSLKAGGTGLNLTRANHVFHVDRWWNPAVEDQATDRAFRIGQKQNVQVHKFVSTGTLEEKISAMIASKKELAEQTVDTGENWLTELDTNQLRDLLLLERDRLMEE
ncbi:MULTISPECIES: DEAD/DEAH box helicase [unclassified Picosynechococcus]|uniref:DEAD/DEAH box helicase n=1 Tax=unclassified Picosynechococcus TaxID=3079910 RepID=UPI00016DC526|nr:MULTISPECIES: DEAD/DEAH box helicase [unclassified Picosynechococcus]ACA98619.1 SNF2 helicase, putative [Picosynechococcus sp. PCC 7002]SMH40500.1 Superfamily II DNA or RNA helicase, SNF2 family [Picosynechococcus sp. OG1]